MLKKYALFGKNETIFMKKTRPNLNLLPIGILNIPNPVDSLAFRNIEKEIEYLDDERLVIEKTNKSILGFMLFLIGGILGIPFLMSLIIDTAWLTIILGILLLIALSFTFISEYADRTDKYPYECEFNRQNGTVTYSKFIRFSLKREIRSFSFFDCEFEVMSIHSKDTTIRSLDVNNRSNNEFFSTSFQCIKREATLETMNELFLIHSFLQWYMDKNRPLPPGKFFDQYRERDYERRKAYGFQKALTPSFVEMIEFDGTPYKGEDEEKNLKLLDKFSK